MGARGLVIVNAVVMLGRIGWSATFMKKDLAERGGGMAWGWSSSRANQADGVLAVSRVLPDKLAILVAGAANPMLVWLLGGDRGGVVGMGMRDLANVVGLLGLAGSMVLYHERHTLRHIWATFNNPPIEDKTNNKPKNE